MLVQMIDVYKRQNVYLVCLSRTRGVVTKAYGSKEELAYIHGLTGVERHMTLMNLSLIHISRV